MAEPDVDLAKHIAELSKNAEAGVALVTSAVLDEWLQKLLLIKMRKLSNTVAERIFDNYGPLYELAPKADLAYALSLIDDETLAVLRVVRDIRNKVAHTRTIIHFASVEIDSLCRKLPGWKQGIDNLDLFNKSAVRCAEKIDAKTEQILFGQVSPLGT